MLKENLAKVEENIQAACDRAGRKREEVTLIALPYLSQNSFLGLATTLRNVIMRISLLRIFKTLRIHFYRLKYSVHISRKHPAFLILLKLPSLHVRIVYGMTTWMYYIQSGKKPESRLRSNSDFKQ